MKTSILVGAIFACALLAPIASAQQVPALAKQAMSMDMNKQMTQMQENMEKMQQQMDKLRATTDVGERQKLMQEHMRTMQESMAMMRGRGGAMMMGGEPGGMGPGMMGQPGGMGPGKRGGDPAQRQDPPRSGQHLKSTTSLCREGFGSTRWNTAA